MPEFISSFAVGPLLGLAANGAITILCLVTLSLYRHYHPLRSLFFFYLFLTFCFLGWVIYGLQKSEESILLGYRIDYASLALLPACWAWFISALFDERQGRLRWIITVISLILAAFTLLGKGPYFFGLPLEHDPIARSILRPQSQLLRPLIQSFCLAVCLFYLIVTVARLWRLKDQRHVYLVSVSIGLLLWFLGGLHDAIRATGVAILIKDQVLWFASLWLSIFLTIAVTLHFRSIERAAREALERLDKVKSEETLIISRQSSGPLYPSIKGNIPLLRRMIPSQTSPHEGGKCFETIEKQLTRLINIQNETDKIIRYFHELERDASSDESNRLPADSPEPVSLYSFVMRIFKDVKQH